MTIYKEAMKSRIEGARILIRELGIASSIKNVPLAGGSQASRDTSRSVR